MHIVFRLYADLLALKKSLVIMSKNYCIGYAFVDRKKWKAWAVTFVDIARDVFKNPGSVPKIPPGPLVNAFVCSTVISRSWVKYVFLPLKHLYHLQPSEAKLPNFNTKSCRI